MAKEEKDQRGLKDKVNAYSAKTRKSAPISKKEHDEAIAKGKVPQTSKGSKAEYTVMNKASEKRGATMKDVKKDYKAGRKSGLSPDEARSSALSKSGAKMTKDSSGKKVK